MRLVAITDCQPGHKLGRAIYNEDGLILLASGMELTDKIIRRLDEYGINHVYVHDPRTEDIVLPETISDETRTKALSQIRTTFRSLMEDTGRRQSAGALAKDMKDVLTMIIDDLSSHKAAMLMLMDMGIADHYLYHHSLNVCIMACTIGLHLDYDRTDLLTFGLGALLHDIGKTKIPPDILGKKDRLTAEEYEIVKQHCEHGFRMLKDEANVPLLAAHCALQHHERMDGSGYPRGLVGDDIHEYAQWVAIFDSFDAMTSRRVYRDSILPHQAMEVLYAGAGAQYNKDKVRIFRDKVATYPLGVTLKLSGGETAVVVDINAAAPQRPVVRILEDANGVILQTPYEIDLSKQLSVMIVGYREETDG